MYNEWREVRRIDDFSVFKFNPKFYLLLGQTCYLLILFVFAQLTVPVSPAPLQLPRPETTNFFQPPRIITHLFSKLIITAECTC